MQSNMNLFLECRKQAVLYTETDGNLDLWFVGGTTGCHRQKKYVKAIACICICVHVTLHFPCLQELECLDGLK